MFTISFGHLKCVIYHHILCEMSFYYQIVHRSQLSPVSSIEIANNLLRMIEFLLSIQITISYQLFVTQTTQRKFDRFTTFYGYYAHTNFGISVYIFTTVVMWSKTSIINEVYYLNRMRNSIHLGINADFFEYMIFIYIQAGLIN